ncbi:MAG: hypothetical protein LC713_00810 [Actinobacteria bacterium]|nr:hypothetical protein [Actinomycetota bacterium]
MRTDLRYRVAVAGAELQLLVLALEPDGCVGVDLDSGAFVRALYPGGGRLALSPFDVASVAIGGPLDPPDASRPEAVLLESPPQRVGRLRLHRAERYLHALRHPPHRPLLGFQGVSVPYWTLSGDQPSLALVEPSEGPHVVGDGFGYSCRFGWEGLVHQLPLADADLTARLADLRRRRCSPRELTRVLGYVPGRLLLVVAGPHDGHCTKQVAALLPSARRTRLLG